MNPIWFVRMAKWARHPPSKRMVKLVLAVLAFVAALYGIEYFFGWPEWLTPEAGRRIRFP